MVQENLGQWMSLADTCSKGIARHVGDYPAQAAPETGGPTPGVWNNATQVVTHLAPGLGNIVTSLSGAGDNAQSVIFGTIKGMMQRGYQGDNSVLVISDSCLNLGKRSKKGTPQQTQMSLSFTFEKGGFHWHKVVLQ